MANTNWKLLLVRALLIIAAGFWVFAPALQGGWLMDDDFYLPANALLGDPARIWKIWFAPGSQIEYYPIEATLQSIQWNLWQNNTLGYHLTNLVLHLVGALLVWRLLGKFGLRHAWLGGLLFAIHPVIVESVAWIAEFKNVLSLPPFLLAMSFWIDYEEKERGRDYRLALEFFLVAMLCKISMAPFPLVILLYAWWKRGRIGWGDLKASAPFFTISFVLGLTTILVGTWFRSAHHQTNAPYPIGGFLSHLALAGTSIAFYLKQCLWPVGLLPLYPKWTVNPPSPIDFLPWLALAVLFAWFWCKRKGWGRHVILGLGFFLINIAPFIGLTGTSYMVFTWVMDHFVYLPIIGLIGLAIAALDQIDLRLGESGRPLWVGAVALLMAIFAWGSHAYAGKFDGPEKLWSYTVEHNPSAFLAQNNLGNILFVTGRVPEAIDHYKQALLYNPYMGEANNNLGFALETTGQTAEAISYYERALESNPHFAMAQANLGNALVKVGRSAEAIEHYESALQIDPGNSEVRDKLAKLRAAQTP